MKKIIAMTAVILALSTPMASFAAMDHSCMNMEHSTHKGDVAHEEMVDGVNATFKIINMKEQMKAMKMEMKETHHLMVEFRDAKSSKALTEGEVKVKVQGPDKIEQTKELMGMEGHFGSDFDLSRKGKYYVTTKFKLSDGKVRSAKFCYTVK